MSGLTHDDTVTVQSFEDHLGFPLNAFDEIKLEDVIIAWCSQSGESSTFFTVSQKNKSFFPGPTWPNFYWDTLYTCSGWLMRPGDLTKVFGTCQPALVDEVTPGWVWRDEAGERLDVTRFNSSHLA